MKKSGLNNDGVKCWFNSIMQLLSSIQEIDEFLRDYDKNDDKIKKFKIFNNIIHQRLKHKDSYDTIKNELIKSLDFESHKQQDAAELLNKINFLDNLSTNNVIETTLFNRTTNKICKENITIKYKNPLFIINTSRINENNNIIDKIFLDLNILRVKTECNTDKTIKLENDKLKIIYNELNSSYILINYITYIIDENNNKINVFKPVNIYKKFSFNNNNYIIKGIIIHSGDCVNSGHYFYIEYNNIDDTWIEYNDKRRSIYNLKTSKENIYSFDNSYTKPVLFLYKKEKDNISIIYQPIINFNLDDLINELQEVINNYKELTPELLLIELKKKISDDKYQLLLKIVIHENNNEDDNEDYNEDVHKAIKNESISKLKDLLVRYFTPLHI
jgi:hypothetical protein